jgi:hypothetical protein
VTSLEGVHLLALFSSTYTRIQRTQLTGWLEIPGSGESTVASKKSLTDILKKVTADGGIIVVPHPFAPKIGLFDSARKINTKIDWLESGCLHLMQISPDAESRIRYHDRDAQGNWVNRYVLASASPEQVSDSTYCLAPFNRSDAHKASEIPDGCSWFRMSEPTIAGLKQVACEPRTRIARDAPPDANGDCILGVRIQGGYCDGQTIFFNERLNCVIGPNHAGKSAILDFLRFVLTNEERQPPEAKRNLLVRLGGILGEDGHVEVYVRQGGAFYAVRRKFGAQYDVRNPSQITGCSETAKAYLLDGPQLTPVKDFHFPIEVYEQGRISRLREDVERQLEMLDEFAGLGRRLAARRDIIAQLSQSADRLAPLYEGQDDLESKVRSLPELRKQLSELEKLAPGDEEKRWSLATTTVESIEESVQDLSDAGADLPTGGPTPKVDAANVAESQLLRDWVAAVNRASEAIEAAHASIQKAISTLSRQSSTLRSRWENARATYEKRLSERLAKVGVESPREVIELAKRLRREIEQIEGPKQRRLDTVRASIGKGEAAREESLARLEELSEEIRSVRISKAQELTDSLDGQIKVTLAAGGDSREYRETLEALFKQMSTASRRIRDRDEQVDVVVSRIDPLSLARALKNGGRVTGPDGSTKPLRQYCLGLTENTATLLLAIAEDVRAMNRLQTTIVSELPVILVRRRGEDTFGNLSTGLSPGEQSAAILTVALQTRTMPLIIDQPEDELGYSYVAHLIVPKVLSAKAARQLIVVTHNANIPVLGDADQITRMENRPGTNGSRECVVEEAGCFENPKVTSALLELEGGPQAFRFRHHRYALPGKG